MNNTISELSQRLVKSLDSTYNVVDMEAVLEIISTLESTKITREQLEVTRLGKFINLLRRKTTNESLARRSKNLLKKWREMVMPGLLPSSNNNSNSNFDSNEKLSVNSKNGVNVFNSKVNLNKKQLQSVPPLVIGADRGGGNANVSIINHNSHGGIDFDDNSSSCKLSNPFTNNQIIYNKKTSKSQDIDTYYCTKNNTKLKEPTSFANIISLARLNFSSNKDSKHPATSKSNALFDDSNQKQTAQEKLPRIPRINKKTRSNINININDDSLIVDDETINRSQSPLFLSDNQTQILNNNTNSSNLMNGLVNILTNNNSTPSTSEKYASSNNRSGNISNLKKTSTSTITKSTTAINLTNLTSTKANTNDDIFVYHDSLSNSESVSHFSNSNLNSINKSIKPNINDNNNESDLTFSNKFINNYKSNINLNSDTVIIDSSSDDDNIINIMDTDDFVDDSKKNRTTKIKLKISGNKKSCLKKKFLITPSSSADSSRSNTISPLLVQSQQSALSNILNNEELLLPVMNQNDKNNVNISDQILNKTNNTISSSASITPRRRGRKKGSKGCDYEIANLGGFNVNNLNKISMYNTDDASSYLDIKNKLASFSNNSKKIKTTKELLADIQNKKTCSATSSPILQNSSASQPNVLSPSSSDNSQPLSPAHSISYRESTTTTPTLLPTSTESSVLPLQLSSNQNTTTANLNNDLSNINIENNSNSIDTTLHSLNKANNKKFNGIDQEILYLVEQLPKLEANNIKWDDFDVVPCTCKLELVTDTPNDDNDILISNEIAVINNNKVYELVSSSKSLSSSSTSPPSPLKPIFSTTIIPLVINNEIVVNTVDISSKSHSKKPIKSIFDVDDDDDENELSSNTNRNTITTTNNNKININSNNNDNMLPLKPTEGVNTVEHLVGIDEYSKSKIDYSLQTITVPIKINNNTIINNDKLKCTHNEFIDIDNNISEDDHVIELQSNWQIKEDPECKAKLFYETNRNNVTNYHIKALQKYYLSNINGNWDDFIKVNENLPIPDDENNINNVVPKYNHIDNSQIKKFSLQINKKKKEKTKKLNKRKKLKTNKLINDQINDELNDINKLAVSCSNSNRESYNNLNSHNNSIFVLEKETSNRNNITNKKRLRSSTSSSSSSSLSSSGSDDENESESLLENNNDLLTSFNKITNDNITGIKSNDGSVFKEWHEILHLKSYKDEPLTILPYVVID